MTCPTVYEFACMADDCYSPNDNNQVPTYTRVHSRVSPTGFKAARYQLASGNMTQVVLAFAGTDFGGQNGTDFNDILADVGFASNGLNLGTALLNPAYAALLFAGKNQLQRQITDALEMTSHAVMVAGRAGEVFVVGHSLGGGLAQIVAATVGLRGVAFNAPTVSQLGYNIAPPENFQCINDSNDPISIGSRMLGIPLGVLQTVNTGSDMKSAHGMTQLAAHLGASGANLLGQKRPFAGFRAWAARG